MRKILILAAFAGVMASCNTHSNRLAQQATIDSLKNEISRKELIDSVKQSMAFAQPVNIAGAYQPVASPENMVAATPVRHTSHHHSYAHARSSQYTGYRTPSYANAPQPVKKHRDWSAKAKGSVIGAGAGAVAGALIDRRKGRGAIIGGLLGAGTGFGIGALLDRK